MQSASDGVGTDGRTAIDKEATQLTGELDRISNTTEFNGAKLFQQTAALTFQVGIRKSANDSISVDTSGMKVDAATLLGGTLDLKTDAATSQGFLDAIDTAISTVSGFRADLGAVGNRLQSAVSTIQTASENLSAADSRIRDVDVAEETSKLSRSNILAQAGVSVLAQANQMPQMALKLLG
jgi:flagellin